VAAGGRLGTSWRARRRAARKGNIAGIGEGRRVEVDPAGGGARGGGGAAARGEALRRRQEEQSRGARARGRRREGGGPGAYLKILEISGTSR
jgi:hypothetical protein